MGRTVKFGDERLPPRFWSKCKVTESSCWLWTGFKKKAGYGRFGYDGKVQYAHRVSYGVLKGPLPPFRHGGLELDHLCRNRSCVNPEHCELVTHKLNVNRGIAGEVNGRRSAAKTHCPQGHEYSGDNLYISPTNGGRICKACQAARRTKIYDAGRLVEKHSVTTHCKHGHLYDEANTYYTKQNYRVCRACRNQAARYKKVVATKVNVA